MKQKIFKKTSGTPLIKQIWIISVIAGLSIPCGFFASALPKTAAEIPAALQSEKTAIVITKCFQGTNAMMSGERMIDVELNGAGFGSTPGKKYVKFGFHAIQSPYGTWSNTRIRRSVSVRHFRYGQKYPVCIAMKNRVGIEVILSGRAYIRPLMLIYQVEPREARPGAVISLEHSAGITMGWFGTAQGTKKLFIGRQPATVISWNDQKITARVPSMLPGYYKLYIQEGGRIISQKKSFTVKRGLIKRKMIR